ncbi:MAG: UbiA family prenyltransferase [Deltaproteobacteria bacterium]|nr:UbiA family prenyltransferase [Deltaproteobacteria bacterium]
MMSPSNASVDQQINALREEQVWRIFADISRIHITTIAALGVFTFGWLFVGTYQWLITAACALDWYIVNLINKTVDLEEDSANEIPGTVFVHRKRKLLLSIVISFLLVSLIVVHFLNPAITGLRITCHVLGFFYNFPLLPGKRRLKQIYFWKNNASAVGFLVTVFGYPLATACWGNEPHCFPPGISWATVMFSAVFFYLFEISYEVIYDLRDVKGDAVAGIQTYPVVHGISKAIHIIDGLIFTSIAVLTMGYLLTFVPWRIFVMAAAPFLQLVFYKNAMRRGITAKDCIRITWMGVAMLVAYHLWVVAGLPGIGL